MNELHSYPFAKFWSSDVVQDLILHPCHFLEPLQWYSALNYFQAFNQLLFKSVFFFDSVNLFSKCKCMIIQTGHSVSVVHLKQKSIFVVKSCLIAKSSKIKNVLSICTVAFMTVITHVVICLFFLTIEKFRNFFFFFGVWKWTALKRIVLSVQNI